MAGFPRDPVSRLDTKTPVEEDRRLREILLDVGVTEGRGRGCPDKREKSEGARRSTNKTQGSETVVRGEGGGVGVLTEKGDRWVRTGNEVPDQGSFRGWKWRRDATSETRAGVVT